MIDVSIIGVAPAITGELVRILINHPDVYIHSIVDEKLAGANATDCFYGLVGERELTIIDSVDVDVKRAYFICANTPAATFIKEQKSVHPQLHIIDATFSNLPDINNTDAPLGLSEIFRKMLVRGATSCVVAAPIEAAALVSLFPLALNLLLAEDLTIYIETSPQVINISPVSRSKAIIKDVLMATQKSFSGNVNCKVQYTTASSCLRFIAEIDSYLDINEVKRLYDNVYDDHNFTFIVDRKMTFKEVSGTNKCLIFISKPLPGRIRIDSIIDASLRGNAGEAVHAMNLLYGLTEKTGLTFKSSFNTL